MRTENTVGIIIPIYKNTLTTNELKSFRRCIKILNSYEIILVCSQNLKLERHKNEKPDIKVEFFDSCYFENISSYNKLLLSKDFYLRFKKFRYILIYQLDAWVFRDDLSYWCGLGYDYIGAPWIDMNIFNWLKLKIYPRYLYKIHWFLGKGRFLTRVGNGGLSLRKVSAFIANLNLFHKSATNWRANEDSFFSHYIKTFNPFFRIAPYKKALSFSFDIFPQKAFVLNNHHLPFGCHAWDKNNEPYAGNMNFWNDIIANDLSSENNDSNS